MKRNERLCILVIVLIVLSLACSSSADNPVLLSEGDNQSQENNSAEDTSQQPEPTSAPAFYGIGDVIGLSDHQIAVEKVDFFSTGVKVDVVVFNSSDETMNMSSLLSFTARNEDGTNLDQEYFDCGTGLDGAIPAGGLLRGSLCWTGATAPIKVYYEPSLLGSNTVVWAFEDSGEANVSFEGVGDVESFKTGDVISLSDHTIVMESAEIANGLLTATFFIENTGSEELNVSSIISFSAQLPDGTQLQQEYFDCSNSLDGSVIAGDKLRGQICWTNAEYPVNVYYEPAVFGSSIVVWSVTE